MGPQREGETGVTLPPIPSPDRRAFVAYALAQFADVMDLPGYWKLVDRLAQRCADLRAEGNQAALQQVAVASAAAFIRLGGNPS